MKARQDWRGELPATLEAVEDFCRTLRLMMSEVKADENCFEVELLAREALTNSVVHGCSFAAGKRIYCALRVKPDNLILAIRDEGAGFDWRRRMGRRPDCDDVNGRGLEIYRQYANAVRFNPKGNSVTLIKRFSKGEMK